MKPTPFQLLIGSPYLLPVWLGLALYFFYSHGGDWNAFTPDQQLANIIVGGAFAFAWLMSFPTVFFYHLEQRRYAKSALSPEERWQRQMIRQTAFLVLLAAALLYYAFTTWKSSPDPQPVNYKAAGVATSVGLVAIPAYLKLRTWRSPATSPEHSNIVSWCLPVPKQTAKQTLALPDYCKRVMSAPPVRRTGGAASPPTQPEVNT